MNWWIKMITDNVQWFTLFELVVFRSCITSKMGICWTRRHCCRCGVTEEIQSMSWCVECLCPLKGGDGWKHQLHGVDCRGIGLHEHLLSLVAFKVLIPRRCTGSGFDQAIVIQQGVGFGKRTHGPMAKKCPIGACSHLRSVRIEIMDHRF